MRSLQSSTGESWIVLGERGEQDWSRLRQQIQLAEGFWLGFLFTAASPVANLLRDRTQDLYRSRARLLQHIRPATPAELAQLTGQLFAASDPAPSCLWIEALDVGQVEGQGLTWEEGWRHFLVRLNERRERARRTFHGLMLVAPPPLKIIAREIASDLWSVRSLVLEPPLPRPLKPVAERSLEDPRTPTSSRTTIEPTPTVEATPEQALDWMREAEGLLLAEKPEDARMVAQRAVGALQQAEDERLPASSFPQALALLARTEVAAGDPWAAKEHFKQAALVPAEPATGRATLLRLGEWYDQAFALDDLVEAEQSAELQVTLARSLTSSAKEDPQALRDLSVSLEKLGKIRAKQARLEDAAKLFDESLDIARQIRRAFRDSPQARRDLSISLEKLGDIRIKQARLDEADKLFDESLNIRRQIQEAFGDSPQARRDLSISLEKLGDIRTKQARLDEADKLLDESLNIRRQIRKAVGDGPQTLRDLAVSLGMLSDIRAKQARLDEAARLLDESLDITRQIRKAFGDSPQALRDLAVNLWKQSNLALANQDSPKARPLLEECVELCLQLVELYGEQPEVHADLALVQEKLAEITNEAS